MEVSHLTYGYDNKNIILKDVNVEIKEDKVTSIIGPNGSGKSTLLGVMANYYKPQFGSVILDGKILTRYKAKELARKLAIVNQHNGHVHDLTVEKLVSYGRLPYKSMFSSDKEEDEKVIDWALKVTNIDHKRDELVDRLSGGERQRVWIAMALAQKTKLLFLDEPTTYLDIYHQYEVLELVKQLNEEHGITIVMVLHDINQAIRYSDEIVVMKDGRIYAHDEPKQIITEKMMKDVYGIEVMMKEEERTGLYILPLGI